MANRKRYVLGTYGGEGGCLLGVLPVAFSKAENALEILQIVCFLYPKA